MPLNITNDLASTWGNQIQKKDDKISSTKISKLQPFQLKIEE